MWQDVRYAIRMLIKKPGVALVALLGMGVNATAEGKTPNGHPVALLDYKFWQKLGGDTGIVGSTIMLNGRAFSVIGVAPPHFTGVDVGVAPDFWLPMAMQNGDSPRIKNDPIIALRFE